MDSKELWLGTALWGWTVTQQQAHQLLDTFYSAGFRTIDTATNYPIDGNKAHFRWAENCIALWIRKHQIKDLRVIVKVGSESNSGGPQINLSNEYLHQLHEHYHVLFESNLDSLWLHWDDRNSYNQIQKTLDLLKAISPGRIGLSGIRHPTVYSHIAQTRNLRFRIQVKHNLFQSQVAHDKPLSDRATFFSYGLNAGGLFQRKPSSRKRSVNSRKPRPIQFKNPQVYLSNLLKMAKLENEDIRNLNHLGMLYAYGNSKINGLIVGPSNRRQLVDSLQFFSRLMSHFDSYSYARIFDLSKFLKE